jgi:hypothetical protein
MKDLPDYIFESQGSQGSLFTNTIIDIPVEQESVEIDQSHGRNKRLIFNILDESNKSITRNEIEERFREMIKSDRDEKKTVNNALSALVKDGDVKGYRPKDIPIRGKFWSLSRWWSGEYIKQQHKPDPNDYLNVEDDEEDD